MGYGTIEILYRGSTHWTMLLAGGIALVFLQQINLRFAAVPLLVRCGMGAFGITGIELAFGLLFNHVLGLSVWDYSAEWGNILGQVCPRFTVMWFLLCIPVLGGLRLVQLVAQRLRSPKQAGAEPPALDCNPAHTCEIPILPMQPPKSAN